MPMSMPIVFGADYSVYVRIVRRLREPPTLADLHAAPMIDLFRQSPEGERLLADHPRWQNWWTLMSERPSMAATRN